MIVVCNGTNEVGKDTFCSFVKNIIGADHCEIFSTVDFVKEVAMYCGWNGEKTPKNRKFLSDLKDALTEWDDIPFKRAAKRIRLITTNWKFEGYSEDETIIFVMCREPKEIQKFVDEFGAKTLIIRRARQNFPSNHADAEVENFTYDIEIENNGTIEDLKNIAKEFVYNELYCG